MSTKKIQILGNFGDHITVDSTLTQTGKAADAKAVGDAISQVQTSVDEVSVIVENLNDKYYTEAEIDSMVYNLNATVDSKSDADHIHDDLYYVKDETNELLSQKSQVQIITWEADD